MIVNQSKQKDYYNRKAKAKEIVFHKNEKILTWDIR